MLVTLSAHVVEVGSDASSVLSDHAVLARCVCVCVCVCACVCVCVCVYTCMYVCKCVSV